MSVGILAIGIGIVLLMFGCAGNVHVGGVDLDTLIRDAERRSYLVEQFQAKFTKTRRSSLFQKDLSVDGTLIFQKPSRFHLALSGAANVEILSDGRIITIIHDGREQETYHLEGERDLARFADPLMLLIQSVGRGALRDFSIAQPPCGERSVVLETEPNGQIYFERIDRVVLRLSEAGDIAQVRICFKDGNWDETVFHSWRALAGDDPAVVAMNNRLNGLSREQTPPSDINPMPENAASYRDAPIGAAPFDSVEGRVAKAPK